MNNKIAITLFLAITYLITILFTIIPSFLCNFLTQITPGLVAVILLVFSCHKDADVRALGILAPGRLRWYLLALLLPTLAIGLSYFCSLLTGVMAMQFHLDTATFLSRLLLLIFMWPLLWAFWEEIGWRGFLQPKLVALLGVRKGLFMTGLCWAAWHYVFIGYCGYYAAGNLLLDTTLFTITIVLMAFVIGWIRIASHSLWPCVVFHSASNAAWQMFGAQFIPVRPSYIYFAGEAGIFNILFWAACCLLVSRRLRSS